MTIKKTLSVFLAVLMAFTAFSVGFYGIAAETNDPYAVLAEKLTNEYVADLTNYTTVNTRIETNELEGFIKEVNAYTFEHKIVAEDNENGNIAAAAESFYVVANELMSTTHGKGYYNAALLLEYVYAQLKAVMDEDYETYNAEAVVTYFMGNSTFVNAGNWYHHFAFEVGTKLYTVTYQRMYKYYTKTDDTGITTTYQGPTAYYSFAALTESETTPTAVKGIEDCAVSNVNYYNNYFLNKNTNPDLLYGTPVVYSEYWTQEYANDTFKNFVPLFENLAVMFGMTELQDGLGAYLKNYADANMFVDEAVNLIFNAAYSLLATDEGALSYSGLLKVLGVEITPSTVAATLANLGYTNALFLSEYITWNDVFADGDVSIVWGVKGSDAFFDAVCAVLSPFAPAIRWLLLDESRSGIEGNAGYQYGVIAILEALSCTDVLTYAEYKAAATDDYSVVYNLLAPLKSLSDQLFNLPVETIVGIMPNFLFFLNFGGMNDALNNILYPVIGLWDYIDENELLGEDVDVYELIDETFANTQLEGINVNLSLPLDIDFNTLISSVLEKSFEDGLTFAGITFAVSDVDLYTMCVGVLEKYASAEGRNTVRLVAQNGDVFTALVRIVLDVLFLPENKEALKDLVVQLMGKDIDEYDQETLLLLIDKLFTLVEENQIIDIVMLVGYVIANNATSITGTLAQMLASAGLSVTDLLGAVSELDIDLLISYIKLLTAEEKVDNQVGTMDAVTSIFDRFKMFFEKILLFFKQLFPFDIF